VIDRAKSPGAQLRTDLKASQSSALIDEERMLRRSSPARRVARRLGLAF
jgi:hypothetical protein